MQINIQGNRYTPLAFVVETTWQGEIYYTHINTTAPDIGEINHELNDIMIDITRQGHTITGVYNIYDTRPPAGTDEAYGVAEVLWQNQVMDADPAEDLRLKDLVEYMIPMRALSHIQPFAPRVTPGGLKA